MVDRGFRRNLANPVPFFERELKRSCYTRSFNTQANTYLQAHLILLGKGKVPPNGCYTTSYWNGLYATFKLSHATKSNQ